MQFDVLLDKLAQARSRELLAAVLTNDRIDSDLPVSAVATVTNQKINFHFSRSTNDAED